MEIPLESGFHGLGLGLGRLGTWRGATPWAKTQMQQQVRVFGKQQRASFCCRERARLRPQKQGGTRSRTNEEETWKSFYWNSPTLAEGRLGKQGLSL